MVDSRNRLKTAKRVVIKVGTSTLTHDSGRVDLVRMDRLCRAIADQMNQGREIVLVTSGAIGVGLARLRMKEKPKEMREKQAVAAVGQCELMSLYSRLFSEYGYVVGQVLLTRGDVDDPLTCENARNTFECLLEKEVLPIVNENDTVSTYEILHNGSFGDNDTLSAVVAALVGADLLILLSDIEGLFDRDPRQDPDAQLIDFVREIDGSVAASAGGAGTRRGTGGMQTKIEAARLATSSGVAMVIANGGDPSIIDGILKGHPIGTLFAARKK
jgi:glutamate 5-kinase